MFQRGKNPFFRLIPPPALPVLALLALQLLIAATCEAQGGGGPSSRDGHQGGGAGAGIRPGSGAKDARPQAPAPRLASPLYELDALSDIAQEIYELALNNKADRIPKRLESLKKYAAAVSYLQDESNTALLPRLGRTITDLDQAFAARNRLDTMRYANRVTLIAATVAVPYKPAIPTELSLLDYNGRELGISSEAKRTEKLSNIVMRMHLAWQTLMPKLVERNAIKELRRFSDVMGRLEAARSQEEYCHLSRQVGAEVDLMKGIFSRQYR